MCLQHRAAGAGAARGEGGGGVNKLVADLFTLPVATTVRRAKTKQKAENGERKQKTENETTTKTTEKLCEKGGKMQALFSRLPAELKGNDACNIAAVAAAAAAADGSRAGSTRSTSTIPGGSRTFQ